MDQLLHVCFAALFLGRVVGGYSVFISVFRSLPFFNEVSNDGQPLT